MLATLFAKIKNFLIKTNVSTSRFATRFALDQRYQFIPLLKVTVDIYFEILCSKSNYIYTRWYYALPQVFNDQRVFPLKTLVHSLQFRQNRI